MQHVVNMRLGYSIPVLVHVFHNQNGKSALSSGKTNNGDDGAPPSAPVGAPLGAARARIADDLAALDEGDGPPPDPHLLGPLPDD